MTAYGHLPPQDLEAERCVLGACLVQNDIIDDVRELVRANDFYFAGHSKLYAAILSLHERGVGGIDAVTVSHELQQRDDLAAVGGPAALLRILETVPHAAHAVHYARIVREMADRRAVINVAEEMIRDCYAGGTLSEDLIAAAEPKLHCILESRYSGDVVSIADAILEMAREHEAGDVARIPTGWPDLDALLNGGLSRGRLYVVAARPSMGKTAVAVNMAVHVAARGHGVVVYSLEQSRVELTERMLSTHSRARCPASRQTRSRHTSDSGPSTPAKSWPACRSRSVTRDTRRPPASPPNCGRSSDAARPPWQPSTTYSSSRPTTARCSASSRWRPCPARSSAWPAT